MTPSPPNTTGAPPPQPNVSAADQILAQAQALHEQGVEHGLYQARMDEAQTCLDQCHTLLRPLLEDDTTPVHVQAEAHRRAVKVCVHQAELHLILFRYEPTQHACDQALRHHKCLSELLLNSDKPGEAPILFGGVVTLPILTQQQQQEQQRHQMELNILEADIYRCRSIVDYRLGNDLHKQWDARACELLEYVLKSDPDHESAQSLLGLFLSYQITTGEVPAPQAAADSERAVDWLGGLYEAHGNDHDLHARRLAVVLRLASYAFRDVHALDESMECVQGALDVATALTRKRPRAASYWFELYHCWCARAEHCELSEEHDDVRIVLDARTEAALALQQLTSLLPMVPKYWRSLCAALIDVADLQDRQGHSQLQALQTADRALDAATQCLACYSSYSSLSNNKDSENDSGDKNSDKSDKVQGEGGKEEEGDTKGEPAFEDLVEYARALLERGRHGFIQKLYEPALAYYEKALILYRDTILKMDRSKREDEFYQELVLRSVTAASNCAAAGDLDDKAMELLQFARILNEGDTKMKLRRTKVMYANSIVSLAELHLKHRHAHYSLELLEELESTLLGPMFEEFPWHVTLGSVTSQAVLTMAKSYQQCNNRGKEIAYRKKYLAYAAKRHAKDYSEWLDSEEEKEETPKDTEAEMDDNRLEELRDACDQVPAVKRYRLPVKNTSTGQVTWHSVEIGSAIEGVDDPLVDQARVWKEDFDVVMADEIRESFCKLHALALGNNVPFTELCDYALSSNTGGSGSNNNNSSGGSNNNNADDGTASTAGESGASQGNEEEEDVSGESVAAIPIIVRIEDEADENDDVWLEDVRDGL